MSPQAQQPNPGGFAWAGWELRVPTDWRPLRIQGDWTRGSVILGSADEPILQVKWWRPAAGRLDPDRWMRGRLRKLRAQSDPAGPRPTGFTHTAWVPDHTPKSGGRAALWYGFAPAAPLLIEALVSRTASNKSQRAAIERVLPWLSVAAADAPTRWAVYGSSFVSPPGFFITGHRLNLGDVAIRLASKDRAVLVLRQVYPAALALARRKIERWLDFPVFPEHRKVRPAEPPAPWTVRVAGVEFAGVRRTGRKRLPSPLGFLAPRWTDAAVVLDTRLDRLLLAEHDSPAAVGGAILSDALASMNWAMVPGADHG